VSSRSDRALRHHLVADARTEQRVERQGDADVARAGIDFVPTAALAPAAGQI